MEVLTTSDPAIAPVMSLSPVLKDVFPVSHEAKQPIKLAEQAQIPYTCLAEAI